MAAEMSISSGNSSTFSHSETFLEHYMRPTKYFFTVAYSLCFMQGPPTTAYILWLIVSGAERGVLLIRIALETISLIAFRVFVEFYTVHEAQHAGSSTILICIRHTRASRALSVYSWDLLLKGPLFFKVRGLQQLLMI